MKISETFIIQSKIISSESQTNVISTNQISNLNSSGITLDCATLVPSYDNVSDLGSPIKRFRNINTVSGSSSIWNSNTINSDTLNLGYDSNNELRILTANNSIIKDDTLLGGYY
jgi:hypothetical protein